MSEVKSLPVTPREGVGKGAARAVRRENRIPAVVYGGGKDPLPVSIAFNELIKALKRGKFLSSLIELDTGSENIRVVPRDVQRDVVKDLPIHVDFLRLSDKSLINLFIPVEFENHDSSPGLKRGGVLNVVRHEVELKVRAGAIPEQLVCDLSGYNIGDTVHISAIPLPAGAKLVIQDRDFTVATIVAPSGLAAASSDDDAEDEGADGEE